MEQLPAPGTSSISATESNAASIYHLVALRTVPFLFIAFVICNIDRMNAGFAALDFEKDLGFGPAVYGLGASLFFVGYSLFELPSNLMLERIGPRKTFMRIMILWGLVSAAQAFVKTPLQFYVVRMLLGAAEAGFLPGTVYYLTQWFPSSRRAQIQGLFYVGMPVAGIVGSPLSGLIMHSMQGLAQLKGWQWMFILEAGPAVLLGLYAWKLLAETPSSVTWLNESDREFLKREIALDRSHRKNESNRSSLQQTLREKRVWVAATIYVTLVCTTSAISFWMPSVIKSFGFRDPLQIGLLSATPPIAMLICMIGLGRRSDRMQERRWHLAIPLLLGSLCLAGLGLFRGDVLVSMVLLTGASGLIAGSYPVFWAIPSTYLPRSMAAAGLGLIGGVGSLGGLIGSAVFGWARATFGSFSVGLYIIAGIIAAGAVITLIGIPRGLRSATGSVE